MHSFNAVEDELALSDQDSNVPRSDEEEFVLENDLEEIVDDDDHLDSEDMALEETSDNSELDDDFITSRIVLTYSLSSNSVKKFLQHANEIYWCDIDPSNTFAITGDRDHKALVWNLETFEVILECTNHRESVTSVGFSYDGKYVATGDEDGFIQVWDISEKKVIYEETVGGLEWFLWHKKCNALFLVETNGHGLLWSIPSGQCKSYVSPGMGSQCGSFTSDGLKIVVGYTNGYIATFDLKSTNALSTYHVRVTECVATSIDIHSNNEIFAAGFSNGTVIVASVSDSKEYSRFQAMHEVGGVAFIAENEVILLAVCTKVGIEIWDYVHKVMRISWKLPRVNNLFYNKELKLLFASTFGDIFLINPFNNMASVLQGSADRFYCMALSCDRKTLLAVGRPNTCEVFNLDLIDQSLSLNIA